MTIIEDITYSLDDVVSQIKDTFGFIYTETSDHEGYILLGSGVRLSLKFLEEEKGLDFAILKFPELSFDLVESPTTADTYASSIESAVQIVDLIKRMLNGGGDGDQDSE